MNDNIEYQECKNKFNQYYEEHVRPHLTVIEQKRKKMLCIFLTAAFFVLAWLGFIVWNMFCNVPTQVSLPPYLDLAGCLAILAVCWPMFGWYRTSKESLLPLLAGFWGEFSYAYQPQISESLLENSKIIKQYDKISTDDCFTGKVDNVPINIIEYVLYQRKYAGTGGNARVIYRKKAGGILLTAQMNKKFGGQTIVVKDKGWMNRFAKYQNLERAGMESPAFEKAFEVYTDNQIEARYLLTTVMLEHLLKLKHYFPDVELSFFNENVFINIETAKNLFECSSFFRSVLNKKRLEKSFAELFLLFSVVKILRLNQKQIL